MLVSLPPTLSTLASIVASLLLIVIAGVVCLTVLRRARRRSGKPTQRHPDHRDPWREAGRRASTPDDQDGHREQ